MKGRRNWKGLPCPIYHAFQWLLDADLRIQMPNRAFCILYHAKRLILGLNCETLI